MVFRQRLCQAPENGRNIGRVIANDKRRFARWPVTCGKAPTRANRGSGFNHPNVWSAQDGVPLWTGPWAHYIEKT